jgi:tRNA pseudouridine38-40 synthase
MYVEYIVDNSSPCDTRTHGWNAGGQPALAVIPSRGLGSSTARWLVRFGYDGAPFGGWARQPSARTVEGDLRDGLIRSGVAPSLEVARLEVASRTDRGVSARGNALAVSSDLSGASLLRALNGISPEVFCTAAAEVADGFRVRHALRRTYRYYEPSPDRDLRAWKAAAAVFPGEVDVRSFGRAVPAAQPTWRTVESVSVTSRRSATGVEVRAPSFVWGMVRKIVAALREHEAGRLSLDRLRAAVRGRERLSLPLARPEPLVLWEVEYPLPWTLRWTGPTRHQVRYLARARSDLHARSEVLRLLEKEVVATGRRTS